jgi:flagellar hook-associated protein 2
MATSGTGTISSAGIGSGLDVQNIITSLMAVEKQPLTVLQTKASTMQTQLSAFGQLQSLVSAFHDAAAPLFSADSFNLTNSSSTDPTSVSAASTTKAQPGSYSVAVSALASGQTTVSAAGQFTDSNTAVGTGSITISLGSWNAAQTTFTPKAGAQDVTIPIGADANTLAGIRDKINGANAGVTASLITDANGSRLALQSTTPGASNGFRVTVADDDSNNTDAAGLSRLAFDPANGVTQMSVTQKAGSTQATINGIAVTSDSTTLTDVVEGMTFSLNKVTTAPVTINVTRNTDALKTMVTSFVSAYNTLSSFLTQATKYDPTTNTAALLQGDSTTTSIQSQLRQLVTQSGSSSSAFSTLSSIGVEFQKDGTLKVNDTKLTAAVKNLPELQKALANVDVANPSNNGFGKKIATWADNLLAFNGSITSRQQSIQDRIKSNQKDQDSLNARLALTQQRITAQYTALDQTMANANSLSKYVTQQITTWNNQKSS